MKAQIKVFKVFGIQIGLHYGWLLIAVLIALSLAGQFAATNRRWGSTIIWGMAIVTTLLFFATIIIHELSHAVIAKARGLPVKAITLFALPARSRHLDALALFNMVTWPTPVVRIARAALPIIHQMIARRTRLPSNGNPGAFAFILIGLFRFFNGAGFGGLWLTFIGWFLLDAARSSGVHVAGLILHCKSLLTTTYYGWDSIRSLPPRTSSRYLTTRSLVWPVLMENGVKNIHPLYGGFDAWQAAGLPVETKE